MIQNPLDRTLGFNAPIGSYIIAAEGRISFVVMPIMSSSAPLLEGWLLARSSFFLRIAVWRVTLFGCCVLFARSRKSPLVVMSASGKLKFRAKAIFFIETILRTTHSTTNRDTISAHHRIRATRFDHEGNQSCCEKCRFKTQRCDLRGVARGFMALTRGRGVLSPLLPCPCINLADIRWDTINSVVDLKRAAILSGTSTNRPKLSHNLVTVAAPS